MVRYHDSRSRLNADIETLETCVYDYVEQLKVECAKSEHLELIVSLISLRFLIMFVFCPTFSYVM